MFELSSSLDFVDLSEFTEVMGQDASWVAIGKLVQTNVAKTEERQKQHENLLMLTLEEDNYIRQDQEYIRYPSKYSKVDYKEEHEDESIYRA